MLVKANLDLTYDKIKEVVEEKGYAFFDKGDYNLNIGGIRCITDTNQFDDILYCAYRENGEPKLLVADATTDPGEHWLINPLNGKGAAILVPGQYRGVYQVGPHGKSKYEALVQRGGRVKVYRDNDRDTEHDMESESITEGYYGINIHRSNPYSESSRIDKWSAGCQVFKKVKDFNLLMTLAHNALRMYKNSFTYTLLEIADFE